MAEHPVPAHRSTQWSEQELASIQACALFSECPDDALARLANRILDEIFHYLANGRFL